MSGHRRKNSRFDFCDSTLLFAAGSPLASHVLSKLARARGGVRPHRGFTVKFTAPGAPHLGHHHLPPIPRCRHHAPGAYRPRLPTYVHRERLSCTLFSAHLDSPREKAERRRAHKRSRGLPPSRCDFPRPFVQTASFPRNSRLKRLPKPQKVERRGPHVGVFTALGPAPGAPHLGHHGRGRGPTCGDHSDAPVRPHPPPRAG